MDLNPWEGQTLSGNHCPVCDATYRLVDVLFRRDRICKVIVRCERCGAYGLGTAFVYDEQDDLAPFELLEHHDAEAEPVSENDVAAMHVFLQTFAGDFKGLFAGTLP